MREPAGLAEEKRLAHLADSVLGELAERQSRGDQRSGAARIPL